MKKEKTVMKTILGNKMKAAVTLLIATIAIICLSGCAGTSSGEPTHTPWYPAPSVPVTAAQTPAPDPVITPEKDPVQTGTETPDAQPEGSSVESALVDIDPASLEGVARLKDLVGNYAITLFSSDMGIYVVVDTEDEHNPYDLTWRYGPVNAKSKSKQKEAVEDPEWDALYRSYVDACDWSLVFDADYYKKAFPMLAKLYHENDELLLEHFQTQGVHEGRQASAAFNVAAYMENCGEDLVEAFGEDYECYYFYYMLNQDTQGGVDTANKGGVYPRWLTLELSLQQSTEHEKVNSWRKIDGADPVELDPEVIAFANYRAWHDAEHNFLAHDWTKNPNTSNDVNDCLDRTGREHFAENTIKWLHKSSKGRYENFAFKYAVSPEHRESMTSEKYFYSGYSNPYWSDNPDNPLAVGENAGRTGYACQFDLFTEAATKSPYKLD